MWQARVQAAHSAPPYLGQAREFAAVPATRGAAASTLLRGPIQVVAAAPVAHLLADLSRALPEMVVAAAAVLLDLSNVWKVVVVAGAAAVGPEEAYWSHRHTLHRRTTYT